MLRIQQVINKYFPITECIASASGIHWALREPGDGKKALELLPRLTLAVSSLSPDSQPPRMPFEPAEFRSLLHLGKAAASPVIDVTAVPGAALLIFNAAFTAAELPARRTGGGHAESLWGRGREEGTAGKGLHKPKSPQRIISITWAHFSP